MKMNNINTLALISALVLSTSSVFAQTDTQNTNTTNQKIEAIIAEIEKARDQKKKKIPLVEKKVAAKTTPIVTQTLKVEKVPVKIKPKETLFEHTITLPTVPTAPKAIQLSVKLVDENGNIISQNLEDIYPKRDKVIFSSNVAPERFNKKKKSQLKEVLPGDIKNGRVTAYLQSPLLSVDEVTRKLKAAGFEILSTFKTEKKGKVVSIVFTNDAMKRTASMNIRGFAGTLRVVVDTKNKLVNISNPLYIMKAFMQVHYNAQVAEKTLTDLRSQFSDLTNSPETVKFLALDRYQFMENMPYYQDMKIIAKAKNEELLKRAKKSKKTIYIQHLDNGSIVVGVKLGKRTSKFVKKIGYQNSGILPYPVLIENGEAKIMAPQYYIAIMYPKLKMSKFMTIATVPGAINKDIDKIFR